ncbi:hypothetical protein GCM10008018_24350 [Paenibacillus marchantiophytorum]|uniref:DUF5658 domain-containing protein n=1 Tax=Paenibacillus marchantiophytorum TaxID=1619310 RepID=A0ABQ1ELY4_9BACL|nr:hypothetical protein GCM10008018_24350 [Paenibacillus marchantiophytorum]
MKYIIKSVPVLFLTIFYGLVDTMILEYSIFGEGSDPPVMINLKELILYHLVLPLIVFFFVFMLYSVVSKFSIKVSIITIAIYFIVFEIWIMNMENYYNGKV